VAIPVRIRAALVTWAVLSMGCGAREPLADADEEAAGEPQGFADPCEEHATTGQCCKAGCQAIHPDVGGGLDVCISVERDCAKHPEACAADETCVLRDGGCSYGYEVITVGQCVPR
jgi:hypothetical protein